MLRCVVCLAVCRLPADVGSLQVLQHLDVSKNMLWALPSEVRESKDPTRSPPFLQTERVDRMAWGPFDDEQFIKI
jgi:hypothetical protein